MHVCPPLFMFAYVLIGTYSISQSIVFHKRFPLAHVSVSCCLPPLAWKSGGVSAILQKHGFTPLLRPLDPPSGPRGIQLFWRGEIRGGGGMSLIASKHVLSCMCICRGIIISDEQITQLSSMLAKVSFLYAISGNECKLMNGFFHGII